MPLAGVDASAAVGDVWPLICFGPIRRINFSTQKEVDIKRKLYFRLARLRFFVVFCYSYLVNFNHF